jgi:hypothetical protein
MENKVFENAIIKLLTFETGAKGGQSYFFIHTKEYSQDD